MLLFHAALGKNRPGAAFCPKTHYISGMDACRYGIFMKARFLIKF